MKKSFSAVQINDEKELGFCASEYSRFKYGSKTVARKFGKLLAERFFQSKEFHELVCGNSKQIVVCSSPYHNIPTATFAMKDYFVAEFNRKLVEFGLEPVFETKIVRTPSYVSDYSTMSASDRFKAISSDAFYMDKEYVKDKFIIFIDDVKITGSHEKMIHRMLEEMNIKSETMFLYFGEIINKDINPKIEDNINCYSVKNLIDINWIIQNEEFLFNTRVVKFILNRDEEEFQNFINYQSDIFRDTLYKHAISNGYHKHEEFSVNISKLLTLLK